MTYKNLGIVIPVYNEGDNILNTIEKINTDIKTPNEIHIIYDFDEDNTLPLLKKFIDDNNLKNIKLIKNYYGRGALNAIKTGMESFQEGAILVMMADLSDELSIVDKMFNKLNEGYDLVAASRYSKGGKQIGGPFLKSFLSKISGISLHYLTGIPTKDPTNSFKLYTKKVLNSLQIESNGGFEIGLEIFVKAYLHGFKITEIPTIWQDRIAGKSNFKLWKWLPKYLKWYLFAVKGKLFGVKKNLKN